VQKGLYLRIEEGRYTFLLPSDDVVSIERRERLQPDPAETNTRVIARFDIDGTGCPIVRLGQVLGEADGEWGQAVFIRQGVHTVGIAAARVVLISDVEALSVKPFTMIGSTDRSDALYTGVGIQDSRSALVFSNDGLATAALQYLELN